MWAFTGHWALSTQLFSDALLQGNFAPADTIIRIREFSILLLLTATGGCVIVPFPNQSIELFGVQSQVVDAQTHAPIRHVQVILPALDSVSHVEADESGRFRIKPVTRWHAGYLLGVLSYPIWPFTSDVVAPARSFKLVAAGYTEQDFIASPFDWKHGSETWLPAKIDAGTLYVPSIRLQRLAN